MSHRNLIIIGSGPAGYTAAIYAARAGLAPLVLAGLENAGGALMNTTEVENFPGFPDGITGPDLMENLSKQAEKFGAEILYENAVDVDLVGPVKTIRTGDGAEYTARAVILSTGSVYRELGVEGEARLSGHGVSFCATCDGFFFRDQDVVVVGGGDSALEEATFLTRFASTVTVLVRKDVLRASKAMVDRALADPKIDIVRNSEVAAIHGLDKVTSVLVRNTQSGFTWEMPAGAVFVAVGHTPRSSVFAGQVTCDRDGYVLTAPSGALTDGRATRTSVAGVFACGDMVDRTYRQAITASASGCQAALDAQAFLAG